MLWLETSNKFTRDHADWVTAGDPTKPEPELKYNHSQLGSGSTPVVPDYLFPAKASNGDPLTDMSLYDNKLAVEDGDDTYLIAKTSPGTNWMDEIGQ